jgi:hypothetical protein
MRMPAAGASAGPSGVAAQQRCHVGGVSFFDSVITREGSNCLYQDPLVADLVTNSGFDVPVQAAAQSRRASGDGLTGDTSFPGTVPCTFP